MLTLNAWFYNTRVLQERFKYGVSMEVNRAFCVERDYTNNNNAIKSNFFLFFDMSKNLKKTQCPILVLFIVWKTTQLDFFQ